ncbi:hypothetical protein F2Q70_00001657 [Brassica cretica]|uniref:Uncharacterized protein n=1 Tax=Brassica cretica TaxID=69181 RepID=A0A8S9IYZ2_BRACR|nr:hypothetical protein F2Q70_00001657 [Brassica cretica]
MSWGLGWKRSSESFRLSLSYGADDLNEDPIRSPSASPFGSPTSITSSACSSPSAVEDPELGFRIDLDWTAGDSEDQVALRLESQLMVALPAPNDTVVVEFNGEGEEVGVVMRVEKRREPLRAVTLMKAAGSGQQYDGVGVLTRLMRSDMMPAAIPAPAIDVASSCGEHWKTVTSLSLSGVGLLVMPVEVTELPLLEKLCLENNKLSVLPPEIGKLRNLKVLRVDNNMLISVPAELRQCVGLVELSLEHNKLIRPLLDFRAMAGLRILRLFGNPLEFLPEILPLHQLRQLSLVNVRIVSDENLRSVNVQIETENTSYFGASRHKLSAFSPLIFRSSSCHHPLLASTLVKIMQDEGNRSVIGKDENAVRQLISMITSDNRHVVEQACVALSSLARDVSVAMQLMKCDIMKPTETVLKSAAPDEVISVLQVVVTLAFVSDSVSQKMLTKDMLKSLKSLCAHKNPEVQRQALLAVGNLAFCLENRRILITSESLRELLMRLTVTPEPRVNKAAARALAILDSYRWQDGAIVANNPTIFAIREAQLLWPDTKIDCLVSIGSGSVPTRVRKGGWRYLDTGQVLIESACSVERVEEALSTLLPMLPEIQYFRFNPVDDRCGMELDETDPAIWLKLEAAIDEYIQSNSQVLKNVCERLTLPFLNDEKWCENLKPRFMNGKQPNRRGPKPSPGTAFPTPFNSPLISGSLPTSPLLFTPDHGPQKFNRIDMVPPLSLDGGHAGKTILSPPSSPPPKRQLYLPLRQMHEKLQNLPQVGIIHLALQNDSIGSILSWQNDVFVVAEPGDLADKFLQSVKFSILSVMQSNRRKAASILSNICSISDLVRIKKCFQVGNIIHRYIGRQTQVMEDDQEIAAFMFRRTVPSTHLTPDDIRWMVGAWRDRIILYSGTFGPTQAVVKAFLDSGAKAVIGPSTEPQETPLITSQGSPFEYNIGENGKFEIGEEEDEEEEEAEREQMEPPTPTATSDWEDSDHEKMNRDDNKCSGLWEDEEEQVSEFVCQLYDMLFRENASVDVALQKALASHRKQRYTCHLPNV